MFSAVFWENMNGKLLQPTKERTPSSKNRVNKKNAIKEHDGKGTN